ncbi:NADH-quinone oxidoreductase subunit C [Sphingobium sp. OAS761]|uniref:NADH-quinone oxidoreductase subunit C n=1 Tax=Sphingobium sp. OAS761 TaxID=2817901 RepID=UPI00209EB439|nr:NADH-quinone oxidoreductase subunit C [Sphingobium sp. OAS761]MCP1471424.1 NADH-quinone oxidoreductase subunit C [Sphingobium sp. OAS761]
MGHSAPRIATIDGIVGEIAGLLGPMLVETVDHADELSFTVVRGELANAMTLLCDGAHYQQLMEIAGVDYPDRPERFEICYHLLSVTRNHRIRVKVTTDEDHAVPTVTHIWPVAGWLEREVFDMYGVVFDGNTDLRRILTDYGFKGHPQRKDFPLTGYVELRYSEEDKRVVYEPVKLAQDFRSFDFMSPWEGAEYILPGDEKAHGEAPGAPAPAAAPVPKTTGKKSETGAGEPANTKAAEKSADAPSKPAAQTDQGKGAAKPEDKA